jgi:hypothetical protein
MGDPFASETFDVPGNVIWNGDQAVVELRRIAAADLDLAFWDDIVAKGAVIGFASLDSPAKAGPRPALRGGIFHTYRCGSTLLCRQLSGIAGTYAVAEPAFASQLVLRAGQPIALLRARLLRVTDLLADGLGPRGTALIVKWPGLLGTRARDLAAALPDIPMLFLHRDPVEVLASIERRPLGNIGAVPAELLAEGRVAATDPAGQALATCAAVIAACCRELAQTQGLRRCDYQDIDDPMLVRLAQLFGLPVDEPARSAMRAAGTWYSKGTPGAYKFAGDSAEKRESASALVRVLAATVLAPALQQAVSALPSVDGAALAAPKALSPG